MLIPELDIFVGNVFIIDWEIFQLWLDGHECEYDFFFVKLVDVLTVNNFELH